MLLRHVGLAVSTEDRADRFYRDLLGLNKSEPKLLPSDLSNKIFGLDAELQIIDYKDENIHFEIFVTNQVHAPSKQIDHQCIEVENIAGFVEKCRGMGVEILQVPKGEKSLTFVKDFDGNLFEIKD